MSYIPTTEPIVDRQGVMTPPFRELLTLIAAFARGGVLVQSVASRVIGFSNAAPTSGQWTQGDAVLNSAATVGQPVGWSCTVSGAPGTWVAWANL